MNIRVHQLAKPSFDIVNYNDPNSKLIQLSYHLGEHYNSVHYMSESVKQLYQTAKNSSSKNSQISKKEEIIIQSTGCTDLTLIRNTLEDFNQDMDSTIDFLCQMKYYENAKSHEDFDDHNTTIGSSSSHAAEAITSSSSFSLNNSKSSSSSRQFLQSSSSSTLDSSSMLLSNNNNNDGDHLLDSCFDLVMSTVGYESGHDIELVRDLITSNNYNAEAVIDMLLSMTSESFESQNGSGSSQQQQQQLDTKRSNHHLTHSSDVKSKKKLTKREKKEAKQREKLAKIQALQHRSIETHTELDEEAIKKFESIQI